MLYLTPFITVYVCVLQFLIGAVLASFLGCFSWRVCHGESVLRGRSHCDACGHALGAKDLIPIVSYLSTRGKCRYCGKSIGKLCLYGELALAGLFVLATLRFDLTSELFLANCFLCILYVVTLTDLYEQIILDRCIIIAIVVRFVTYVVAEEATLSGALVLLGNGLVIAVPVLLLTLLLEFVLKKEALGGGDIKLLFVLGLYLGWAKCLLMLLVACVAGIFYAAKQMSKEETETAEAGEAGEPEAAASVAIPFGPFLAAGAVVALLVGDTIIGWYLSLFF